LGTQLLRLNGWFDSHVIGSTIYLVGGLEHVLFFHTLGRIIPTNSYFSEGLKPPTSIYIYYNLIDATKSSCCSFSGKHVWFFKTITIVSGFPKT
jgi:hypothetical protein